jgi:glycosyltransferase involved in cell wall biosynthesis
MQKKVARALPCIITVSDCARNDISRDFRIPPDRFRIVPNGISTDLFYPLSDIAREPGRIIVTNSADTPLKGLYYLLHAVSSVATHHDIRLVVVGSPKKDGGIVKLIGELGISDRITFTGRITSRQFNTEYARACMAVVPSVYEGFGLPAGEAMACGVPVISTTGGALPEVVGNAGLLVPPADPRALASAIRRLLAHPDEARRLGMAGYRRVQQQFTWRCAAERVAAAYREIIRDHRGFRAGIHKTR